MFKKATLQGGTVSFFLHFRHDLRAVACLLLLAASLVSPFGVSAAGTFELGSTVVDLGEEQGRVTLTTLKTEKGNFTFGAPPQWRLKPDANRKSILLSSPSSASIITVQFVEPAADFKSEANAKKLGEIVKSRFPKGKLIETFTCYSGSGEGIAFELEVTDNEQPLAARVAFIPIKGGMIEFTLQSSLDQAESSRFLFARFLSSFKPWQSSGPSQ